MIQLATFLWGMIVLFAVIGFGRGSTKEMLSLSGIVLALFILEQFRDVLLSPLIASVPLSQQFYMIAGILLAVALFAYQTPDSFSKRERSKDVREGLQEGLLGSAIGALNAYLLFGSLWYYMDNLGYPLSPFIMAPPLDSASAAFVNRLPLVWLLEGNLLTLMVVVMFLFVIIVLV
jgi:hypothetical protein